MLMVATPRGGHLEFYTTLDVKRVSLTSGIYHLQKSFLKFWKEKIKSWISLQMIN